MKLGTIFTGLRKGLEVIEKARKVLTSVEVIGKHLNMMVDDLESIWKKDIDGENENEFEEAEETKQAKY